ncbi:MAG: hypothetical protein LQ351_002751 [Letrouitia transgressa]|nr:MAG: hypothetical protein LQ351_002751 [Letrouitia transgressa]
MPSNPTKTHLCGPTIRYNPTIRTHFTDTAAKLYAWPSRGGVIILDPATAVDLEFLGFNPLDPPRKRHEDQAAEDSFCHRLLALGAKWWDSEARYSIVTTIESCAAGFMEQRVDGAFRLEDQSEPTMREKRLIRVGWPSTGGVWIAEFDTAWAGVDEEDNLVPEMEDLGRLTMARTMDERCELLRDRLRARFYEDLRQYEGYGFFNAWEWKVDGEVGPLLQPAETVKAWSKAYYNFLG